MARVLIIEDNIPRGEWKLGTILQTFPGKDGHIRSVKLRTQQGEYERPIVRCCLLHPQENSNVPGPLEMVHAGAVL